MSETRFRSLRFRLLLPLLATCWLAAAAVALMSAWLGSQWARQNLDQKYQAVERTLLNSSFPLTTSVLRLLADLTQTQLITFSEDGEPVESTVPLDQAGRTHLRQQLDLASTGAGGARASRIDVSGRSYLAYTFQRRAEAAQSDSSRRVLVLFDEEQVRAARLRAAMLPLATGLSTIVLLGTLSLYLTNRLIGRLKRLERRVETVAKGNFDALRSDCVDDEVGRLASAVDSMALQLKDLWNAVQRQQSAKLLHQIAGGLAHQLRNTLTGARMALELHARHRPEGQEEEVSVALREIQQAEDYIRRMLVVGHGPLDRDCETPVLDCLRRVEESLGTIAKHRRREVSWEWSTGLSACTVKDGQTLVAAVSNLVLNAIEAGSTVWVAAELVSNVQLRVTVRDDGTGVPANIASDIFEPFVTSKPEGMGLGLPLVRRSAEYLGGHVQWTHRDGQTVFCLYVNVSKGMMS